MSLPTRKEALKLLDSLDKKAPYDQSYTRIHVENTALAASRIAFFTPSLDPKKAYILGLLHDVGKWLGEKKDHILNGYDFLTERGWHEAAQIALTHTYTLPLNENSCDILSQNSRYLFLMQNVTLTLYDELIQLADLLGTWKKGLCPVETRVVDVLLRYKNPSPFFLKNLLAKVELKYKFDSLTKKDINTLLSNEGKEPLSLL